MFDKSHLLIKVDSDVPSRTHIWGTVMDSIQNKNIDCQFQKFILIFPKKMCVSKHSFKTFMINMPLTSVICGFSNNWAKIIFIFNS